MIVRSIAVQGWRCFANPVAVGRFADGLNVLHAPNACGKSTLFEALLRALLDGHRVSGRDVENLRPWGRPLAPAVTVEFEHGGAAYRIAKRFLDRPSAELERREGGRWARLAEGDAADARVREILTRNPPGRGLARVDNWGLAQVLWVPQGSLALPALSGDLVADIRAALGAQVTGPGSGPLEERIEAAYLRCYTPGGQLKRGKDAPAAVRLCEDVNRARETCREAREHQLRFEDTARRVEDLRARRAQARRDTEALAQALAEARARAEDYRRLRSEQAQRQERARAAEAEYAALHQRIDAIKTAGQELAAARAARVHLQAELPAREREVAERQQESERTRVVLEEVRTRRSAVDAAGALAEEARRYAAEGRRAAGLAERRRRIAAASERRAELTRERSRLVAPDARALRAIARTIKERDDALVRLEAALITLEIVPERPGRMRVVAGEETGERPLAAGVPALVKGAPEVAVDLAGVARVRARGPVGSIEEIRAARDAAVRQLHALTEAFGTTDMEALETLREAAARLEKEIAAAQTEIDTLLAGEAAEDVDAEHATVAAVVAQILAAHPEWRETPPDPEALRNTAEAQKRAFVTAVEAAEKERDTAQAALESVSAVRAGAAARLDETQRREDALAARLAELTGDGVPDADRERERQRLAVAWDAARAGVEDSARALAAFGDDPAGTVATLEKQLRAADETATAALELEKNEEGRLAQLSAQGPYTALAAAEEEAARIERALAGEELRLAAVRLLRDTVEQCRSRALAAVARPVELAATRIVQRIAGSRLGPVQLGAAFEPAHVVPDIAGAPVAVDSMSGGEREQIALATRLALADVLAGDERQLVVLDDVLVATDAGRLARVMRVLEEAAQRLQVLVITCHPERYLGLDGAALFDLERILRDGAAG